MRDHEQSATLTIIEAAAFLGISRSACYNAAKTGQLPTLRIGKRYVVPRLALEQLLKTAIAKCN